jgi:ATP-dependent helicase HrpA
MPAGTRRLLLTELPSPARQVVARLDPETRLAIAANPYGSVRALLDDCAAAAVDALVAEHGGPVRDPAAYAALRQAVGHQLPDRTLAVARQVAEVLRLAHRVDEALRACTRPALLPACADVRQQLAALVRPGFVIEAGSARLPDVVRYLRAAQRRLEAVPTAVHRDAERMATVHRATAEVDALLAGLPPERRSDTDVRRVRWMLEELRVSLFAQELGTAFPVSEQRVRRAVEEVRGPPGGAATSGRGS